MKEGLHPEYHPVVFVDSAADFELVTRSTKTSGETREIDGVDHYVIRVEISSASHPFFTGEQRFVDTAGRVEKFQRKYEQFYQAQDEAKEKVVKKATTGKEMAARDETLPEAAAAEITTVSVATSDITGSEPQVETAGKPTATEAVTADSDADANSEATKAGADPEAES